MNSDQQWAFFAPHENEFVANAYVAKKVTEKGGVFVVLRQAGERLIQLKINQLTVQVDPNRIFTDRGIIASIKKNNASLDPQSDTFTAACERAKQLSQFILAALGRESKSSTWVAMHNNTNGYDDDGKNGIGNVSIIRYQQKLSAGAQYLIDVAVGEQDEDDLFFVTSRDDFEAMKINGWNAVLQNPNVANDAEEDDGSLSVYAAMKGLRYINVEAERISDGFGEDHLQVQQQMVDFTFSLPFLH